MADLITVAWNVYGIKLITRSFFATSASRAFSSVTSSEIGVAFLTPDESFFALSSVLQALNYQYTVATIFESCFIPTVVAMPASLSISRVGLVTKPEPNIRTFLKRC